MSRDVLEAPQEGIFYHQFVMTIDAPKDSGVCAGVPLKLRQTHYVYFVLVINLRHFTRNASLSVLLGNVDVVILCISALGTAGYCYL